MMTTNPPSFHVPSHDVGSGARPRLARVLGATLALLSALLFSTAAAQEQVQEAPPAEYLPNVSYTLTTGLADGRMAFIGVGGAIDGVANPNLVAQPGQVVQITLINGDNVAHDIIVDDFPGAHSEIVDREGGSTTIVFRADEVGNFNYWCTIPGHRQAGMEGVLTVGEVVSEFNAEELTNIVRPPDAVPGPLGDRSEPMRHEVVLATVEREALLADGTTYRFWTFNGLIPGPFIRVKVGDTVDVVLENPEDSQFIHSVDLHAVTGPGGGAVSTQTLPGEQTGFSFKALNPGLYIYHCATPMVAHHISNGMYGMILVEPEGGLPEVDREFYVMQGEIYTTGAYGDKGYQEFAVEKLLNEMPEYYTFNGAVNALNRLPLRAEVGETVRIYFGVGGPNKISSFHVIGEIFDRVYHEGSVTTEPLRDIHVTTVPAGGTVIVDFKVEFPGEYTLVDHALSRAERGLAGTLIVTGEADPEIYDGEVLHPGGH